MLSGDEARNALRQYEMPEAELEAADRALRSSEPGLAGDIVQALDQPELAWEPLARQLGALSRRKRAEVLKALSPTLGQDLATWWEWAAGQPYQVSWAWRAYRSANDRDSIRARGWELRSYLHHARRYPQPLAWHAAWSLHLDHEDLGPLLASAIADGHAEIAAILTAAVRGEHPISGPSTTAYTALLSSPDPAGWAQVEQLIVGAERSEGLRQTVLKAAPFAHPEAFARILDLVVEHRLARFAATAQALGRWVGEDITVHQEDQVAAAAATIRDHLRQPPSPAELARADPTTAFLGIWALAVRDVHAAIAVAEQLQESPDERIRLAAARLLADFDVPEVVPGLTRAVLDSALPVYATAAEVWKRRGAGPMPESVRATLHEHVDALGENRYVDAGFIGAACRVVGSTHAADILLRYNQNRPLDPALLAAASADGRWIAAKNYAKDPAQNRAALFALITSRAPTVRAEVGEGLLTLPSISEGEARILEGALTRKAHDLRKTALAMLRKQDPQALDASIERLAAGKTEQRRAARELGKRESPPDASAAASAIPSAIRFTVADRTPARRPVSPPSAIWQPHHERFRLAWTSLSGWLAEHADVEVQTYHGVELLSNVLAFEVPADGTFPIPEVLGPWWDRIQPQLTDGGLELALLTCTPRISDRRDRRARPWLDELTATFAGPVASELDNVSARARLLRVIRAVAQFAWRDSWAEPILSLLETAAAALPLDGLLGPAEVVERRGRRSEQTSPSGWGRSFSGDDRTAFDGLLAGVRDFIDPAALSDDQLARLWRALRFIDEPEGTIDRWSGGIEVELLGQETVRVPDQPQRWQPPARILVEAFNRGVATRADVIDALVAGRFVHAPCFPPNRKPLQMLTEARLEPWAAGADIQSVVSEVRVAAITAVAAPGHRETPLTATACGLRTTFGAQQLTECLAALGRRPFGFGGCLSQLIYVCQPLPDDTAETLAQLVKARGISDRRLVETAVVAPQWGRLIEEHLGWTGLVSAVWWLHAHIVYDGWYTHDGFSAQRATAVGQHTDLDETDLASGVADVQWFHEVIADLGEERFDQIVKAGKHSSGRHKRAELYAKAILGQLDESELVQRITEKRHQDSVRALGLLPLAGRQSLLDRYELLRGFVASDRSSGAQRRASETAAVSASLQNLARTAGYRDPQRLEWAMETEAIRDLSDGPVTATDGDLVVALTIDPAGSPQLSVQRAGKALKSIPAKSSKVPAIAQLRARSTALRKQVRRMRASLESACIRGETFDFDELAGLQRHPLLAPMLRDLVLVDAEGFVGFPQEDGQLSTPVGAQRTAVGPLRIAHPVDLLASGEWPELQHALMSAERRQPFKQLFRELYTLNENERDEAGTSSRRYAGHQLQRRRAAGIFTSRGWVADYPVGFSRTFHQEKIIAWCEFLQAWGSPTEVEDAAIEQVTFNRAGSQRQLPLDEVPPRVFSETMRDLDLVVSVAHASGVDPQASESSIQVRGRLVDETAAMLSMQNVEVGGHHVRVAGTLGTYSIHLGSGVVHRIPGNAVCIVPVSAQQRGRIYLPFADDDPRTAEIIAKVVLLARDDKIKDPTILQQLVR